MLLAYLDAGSGSLILQAVLGGIAGIVVAGRAWKARFVGNRKESEDQPAETSKDESTLTET